MLALTMTKLRGNGEVSWCGVNGIIVGIPEIKRTREGVVVLMNDVWQSAVIYFRDVSSRTLWTKSKFSMAKLCVAVVYGPTEGEVGEIKRF